MQARETQVHKFRICAFVWITEGKSGEGKKQRYARSHDQTTEVREGKIISSSRLTESSKSCVKCELRVIKQDLSTLAHKPKQGNKSTVFTFLHYSLNN